MGKKTKFESALNRVPECCGAYDSFYHHTIDDLRYMVQLEVDLWAEGEESDILSVKQLNECKRFIKWAEINR